MKIVYTGLESAGKSLLLAKTAIRLVKRNKKWQKKYGFTRKIVSNLKFSNEFYKKNADFIKYFEDMSEIIGITGCDIIWDEISSDFSALKKEPMTRKINRWLRQGAKQGVHIYATAQEFHDIHLDFRRRAQECKNVKKFFGSNRSGENLPPVNLIWGLCLTWDIKIHPYNELEPEKVSILPSFFFITKELCNIFDTHQVITSSHEPPYEHVERICENVNCKAGYKGKRFSKVIHR